MKNLVNNNNTLIEKLESVKKSAFESQIVARYRAEELMKADGNLRKINVLLDEQKHWQTLVEMVDNYLTILKNFNDMYTKFNKQMVRFSSISARTLFEANIDCAINSCVELMEIGLIEADFVEQAENLFKINNVSFIELDIYSIH